MSVVMEGNIVSVIMVYAICGNDRSTKVSSDIFYDLGRIAFIIFGINIETIDVMFVNVRFYGFKGRTYVLFKFIE